MKKKVLNSVRVTFRIDDERKRILADVVRREGMSVSLIVRNVLYRYLESYKKLNPVG